MAGLGLFAIRFVGSPSSRHNFSLGTDIHVNMFVDEFMRVIRFPVEKLHLTNIAVEGVTVGMGVFPQRLHIQELLGANWTGVNLAVLRFSVKTDVVLSQTVLQLKGFIGADGAGEGRVGVGAIAS